MKRFWQYIDWVKANPDKTNEYIKLAVARFERDLAKKDSEFFFDEEAAQKFIKFTEMLKQYKDQWAGVPIKLEPWQVFIFGNIYGWKYKATGLRRFRKAFVFVARKNGKSTMMSSVQLWDILFTKGGEAFCAATKRDQSKIVFESVKQMVRQNKFLSSRLVTYNSTNHIVNNTLASKIEALSAESDKMDGLNPSCVVVDEVAAMKDYNIIKVLQSGMGSRPEPLLFEITSGSDDMNSAGHQEFERSQRILEGAIEDDSFFCMLYTLDKEDNWMDEACWIKANPNLGVSVKLDTMQKLCTEAKQNFSLEGEFRIKNLCQFLSPVTAWIPYKEWEKCCRTVDVNLEALPCVGAIDLSKRADFTSYVLYFFDPETRLFHAKHHFYIPEEQIEDKCKADSPMIRKWIDQGYITATPGPIVDYSVMINDIKANLEQYKVESIMYDPWNATAIITEISPLIDLIEVTQNIKNISPFAKEWEAAIIDGKIVDNNPVVKWMVGNADIYRDANGNIKPVKHGGKDSVLHIDGVVTSLMAMGRLNDLINDGTIDFRSPEEIERDMEERIKAIDLL